MNRVSCNVLVVGGGLAGLQAAEVAIQVVDGVVLVDKNETGKSASSLRTAGAIAATLGKEVGGLTNPYFVRALAHLLPSQDMSSYRGVYEKFPREIQDTGCDLSDPMLVNMTVDGVYNRMGWMEAYGLHWVRGEEGRYLLLPSTGHSVARLALLQEGSEALMRALRGGFEHLGGVVGDKVHITRLFAKNGQIQGAYGINIRTGDHVVYDAACVVLACGGADRLYSGISNGTSGDGYLLGLDVGAELANMEFVQFVPDPDSRAETQPPDLGSILLGMGWPLEDEEGKAVKAGPGVTTSEIVQAIHKGSGSFTTRVSGAMKAAVARIELLGSFMEKTGEKLRWRIGADGLLGGVVNDRLQTSVQGLYVAGRNATGCHGAEALPGVQASFSLTSGEEAGLRAAKRSVKLGPAKVEEPGPTREARFFAGLAYAGPVVDRGQLDQLEEKIRRIMWEAAGPVRDEATLAEGAKELQRIEQQEFQNKRVLEYEDLSRFLEVRNLARVGRLVCLSASARKESRGQHVRKDSPTARGASWRYWLTLSGKDAVQGRREVPDRFEAVA